MESGLRQRLVKGASGLCLLLCGVCWDTDAVAQATPGAAAAPPACAKGLEDKVVEKLGYPLPGDDEPADTVSMCKPWPADESLSIVVVAALHPGPDQGDGVEYHDLDVALVRSASGSIVSRLKQEQAIMSDAVRFDGLGIDTARFNLAPGSRAFGVTVSYTHNSRVSPAEWSGLNLYVRDGKKLRLVLSGLQVSLDRGGGMTCDDQDSIGNKVAIGKAAHQGYADLVVTSRTITTPGRRGEDGGCEDLPPLPPVIERRTLVFDGKTYKVPEDWAVQ